MMTSPHTRITAGPIVIFFSLVCLAGGGCRKNQESLPNPQSGSKQPEKPQETGGSNLSPVPIAVPNYSFEVPDLRDEDTEADASFFSAGTDGNTTAVREWVINFRVNAGHHDAGIIDPGNGRFVSAGRNPGVNSLPGTAQGHQVSFITVHEGTGSLTSAGALATVAENKTYTLTVAVGYSLNTASPGDVSLQLLVGDKVACSTSIRPDQLEKGTLKDFSASFTTRSGDPFNGQNLRVRLNVTGHDAAKFVQPSFDNVRVTATQAP